MAQDPKFLSVFDKKKNDDGVSLERLAQIVKDRDIEIVETPQRINLKKNKSKKIDLENWTQRLKRLQNKGLGPAQRCEMHVIGPTDAGQIVIK